jgi:transposase
MDADGSYPLVVLPPAPEAPRQIIVGGVPFDDETQADFLEWLQQAVALLCLYVLHLLSALRVFRSQVAELRGQVLELRCQAHFWEVQHQRAREREEKLKAQLEQSQAQIRELQRRLYSRKSETASTTQPTAPAKSAAVKRKRGQQPGTPGPGRRNHDHLPTICEPRTLSDDQKQCSCCGEPFEEIPGSLDGDILEIEVRAHRRRYQRQRYRRRCTCPGQPAVITAAPPDKLIPKSNLGISIWVEILRRKFEFFTPLYRVLAALRSHGLNLASGTIIGGLQKLVPLFEPLYQQLAEHNRREGHWHCDETRWLVFAKHPGKAGFAWNLWVFVARESIVFVLDPWRSHDVPEGYFGDESSGILNVDRYSAYKAMRQVKDGWLILAFCWAHVRRDFLEVLTSWHELADWAWSWVEEIGELYQRNDQRLAVQDNPAAFAQADRLLRQHVEHIRQRCERERAQLHLRQAQVKVLKSLHNHWDGLTVFVDRPEVPMDNNTAERAHRGPVVGRKNFYGSGSLWSGRLAAMLFSLFQTIQVWQMDVRRWLTAYLTACAKAGGQPPSDLAHYLPWNMTDEQRQEMSLPKSNPPNPEPATNPPENRTHA